MVERSGGNYYVRNGEIAYTEFDGERTGKIYKNYSHPIPNSNRVFYDLMKYSSQYAKLAEKHATVTYNKNGVIISFCEDTFNVNYVQLAFEFLEEPELYKSSVNNKFLPALNIRINDDFFLDYKVTTQQILTRCYGEKTGTALFKEIERWTKGRGISSTGSKYVVYNGVQLYLDDVDYANPTATIGFPK